MGLGPQDDRRLRSPGRRGDLIAGKETYGGGGRLAEALRPRASSIEPPRKHRPRPPKARSAPRTANGSRTEPNAPAERQAGRQAGEPEAAAKPRRQTGELGHARKAAVVKPTPATGPQRPQANRRTRTRQKSGRRQPAPPKRPQRPQAAADAHERPAPSVLRQPHPPAPTPGAAILNRKRTGAPAEGGLRRREIRTL